MSLAEYRDDENDVGSPPTVIHRQGTILENFIPTSISVIVSSSSYGWPQDQVHRLIGPPVQVRYVKVKPAGWTAASEEIVSELGRLPNEWAGPGTVPPSKTTMRDIECVAGYFSAHARKPSVEVDEETGHVTLSWLTDDRQRMFSLLFTGNGIVVGSYSSLVVGESERPWKYPVAEEAQIVAALDTDTVRDLISA